MAPPAGTGTLTEELRGWSDERLVDLLRARPDLVVPVPHDLGALVNRATSLPSVVRALDGLDRFVLQVLETLVVLPEPASCDELARRLGTDPERGLAQLCALALVWGPSQGLRLARPVRQVIGPWPGGLGPPAHELLASLALARLRELAVTVGAPAPEGAPLADCVADALADPQQLGELLAEVSPAAREVLARLAEGPPAGRVEGADRRITRESARSPIDELLARGLLLPEGPATVVLPREVGLHLRGGVAVIDPQPDPPPLATATRDPGRMEAAAGAAAFDLLRWVEELLEAWGVDGPPVLKSGGLGVRELRRLSLTLDVEEQVAALLVEVAYAAGLLGHSGQLDASWLPTPAYDTWRGMPAEHRWAALAAAWLETTRVPGLVGTADEKDKRLAALGYGVDRAIAPQLRAGTLAELAALPPGTAASTDSIVARLEWRQPRRAGLAHRKMVAWTVGEAELLGVIATGALTAAGRALLGGDSAAEDAAAAMAPLLPEPLDYVLLQADLTAVAPGPLTGQLRASLALAAEVESRGSATVYRFTESSVRRALDAGASAADLHRLLTEHSRTPVPQPLTYLVDDVARRHGRIRVGAARCYLRCDDPALLAELLADRRAEQLRLRRLAPTVLAAQASIDTILERLRSMGHAPAAENATGDLVLRRPDARRTPPRPPLPRLAAEPPQLPDLQLAAAVRALRVGDATRSRGSGAEEPGVPLRAAQPWEVLSVLRTAAAQGRGLWIGYVNAEGRATVRRVEPLAVQGGYLSAYDHLREQTRTFSLHRITGIAEDPADRTPASEPAAAVHNG